MGAFSQVQGERRGRLVGWEGVDELALCRREYLFGACRKEPGSDSHRRDEIHTAGLVQTPLYAAKHGDKSSRIRAKVQSTSAPLLPPRNLRPTRL